MITVSLEPNRLIVTGHDESAPKGQNIVCAAVSTLVHTAALAAVRWREKGLLEDCALHLEEGYAFVRFIPKREHAQKLYESFESILDGFRLLERFISLTDGK